MSKILGSNTAVVDELFQMTEGIGKPLVSVDNSGGEVSAVSSVNGQTGVVVLDKADIGLANVDNTSDVNKPISTATQNALDGKATTAQGNLADTALQPADNITELTNNAGYIDSASAPVQSVNTQTGVVSLDADDISDAATANKFTTQVEIDKLAGIAAGAEVNTINAGDNVSELVNDAGYIDSAGAPVQSVNTQTGAVVLDKADVGLANVDNTSDLNKPISTATQNALDAKVALTGNETIAGVKTFNGDVVLDTGATVQLDGTQLFDVPTLTFAGDPTLGIGLSDGGRSPNSLSFICDSTQVAILAEDGFVLLVPLILPNYTVATLPAATPPLRGVAYCSDGDAGSPCLAVYDGTSWKRISLGATVSAT